MACCLVNGQSRGELSIADRGLRFGDGVFETLAVVDGRPQLWDAHIERLQFGCERLGIPVPETETLWADWQALSDKATCGVLRITVTRGAGGVGYAPPVVCKPTRILQCLPVPERPDTLWADGVDLRVCQIRLAIQPVLAGMKHLNRLEQVLARAECGSAGNSDGLLLAGDGRIAEATSANLLIESEGTLIIPDITDVGVDGIMQQWIVEQAGAMGIVVRKKPMSLETLQDKDAMMLCNSLNGVWPVRRLAGRKLSAPALQSTLLARINEHRIALTPEVMGR